MANLETQEFVEWTDGADEEEIAIMTDLTQKQFIKWLLLSLIPVANIFTAGIALFCYNNLCYLKSRGHSTGSMLIRILLLVWGLVVVPLIEVNWFSRDEMLGNHILGWI